jgi:hypothetical protein
MEQLSNQPFPRRRLVRPRPVSFQWPRQAREPSRPWRRPRQRVPLESRPDASWPVRSGGRSRQ